MPNIENLNQKPFTKNSRDNLLNVRRGDILYREDLRTGFSYALIALAITLAAAGGIYVIGKQLLK
jgi:hypothetical protein